MNFCFRSHSLFSKRAGPLLLTVTCLVLALAVLPLSADPTTDLPKNALETTLQISAPWFDDKSKQWQVDQGTGVIVSGSGDFLTASHVIRGWLSLNEAQQREHPITAQIGNKFDNPLRVGYLNHDLASDIALLRLIRSGPFSFAPICFTDTVPFNSNFVAVGFPAGNTIVPVPGKFGTALTENLRWAVVAPFEHGLSGGPVYERGRVVAFVHAGIDVTRNDVTPAQWAKSLVESRISIKENCSLVNDRTEVNSTIFGTFTGVLQSNHVPERRSSITVKLVAGAAIQNATRFIQGEFSASFAILGTPNKNDLYGLMVPRDWLSLPNQSKIRKGDDSFCKEQAQNSFQPYDQSYSGYPKCTHYFPDAITANLETTNSLRWVQDDGRIRWEGTLFRE